MKRIIFFIFVLVVLASFGYAVECDADLFGGDGTKCSITSSLTLNGTYNININGSFSTDSIITINANNIIFDCNGTTIYGNAFGRGIGLSGKNNITIKNCNIHNYTRDIAILVGSYNINIINSTFTTAQQGVYADAQSYNISIINSTFFSFPTGRTGIFIQQRPYNINISNNVFLNNYKSIEIYNAYGLNILYNNEFYNGTQIAGSPYLSDVLISNSTGFNIHDNYFNNGSYWQLRLTYNSTNSTIHHNEFTRALKYSVFIDNLSNNINVSYNNISWSGWNGIVLSSYNNKVYNNNINYSFHHGIDIHCAVSSAVKNSCINNDIYNNYIFNNVGNAMIYIVNGSYNRVYNNTLKNTTSTMISLDVGSKYNNITNNIINDTPGDSFNVWYNTVGNLLNNNIIDNIDRYFYVFNLSYNTSVLDNYINFNFIDVFSGTVNYTSSFTTFKNTNNTQSSLIDVNEIVIGIRNGKISSPSTITSSGANITLAPGNQIEVLT